MGLFKTCQCCGKQITFLSEWCTECFFETHDVIPKASLSHQQQFNIEDQLESLYDLIGERCPYKLAQHFGIKLITDDLLNEEICGMYKSTLIGARMYINANMDIETQETAVYLLVKHHIKHKDDPGGGPDVSILRSDLSRFNRAEKAARKYLKVIAESFLVYTSKSQKA